MLIHGILKFGCWEPWNGTSDEEAPILAAVPDGLPTAWNATEG